MPGNTLTVSTKISASRTRLDIAIADAFDTLSRSRAQELIKAGAVEVNGTIVKRPSTKIGAGSELTIDVPPAVDAKALPQDLPLDIVYQDRDIAVVNKDAGTVVHPGPGHPDKTLVNALLFHLSDLSSIGGVARPGIVHRLDMGTSGLLVVAKNDLAHRRLSKQFADHSANRQYLALVQRVPRDLAGVIETHLARHPTKRTRHASTDGTWGRRALTHWKRIGSAEKCALIECVLETGRTHQIRVHLSEVGHPIIGDDLYRGRMPPIPNVLKDVIDSSSRRPLLHAWQLHLTHPRTEERHHFIAPLPNDYRVVLDAIGIKPPPDA